MARTEGSKNQAHEAKRRKLLLGARERLSSPGGSRASLRELAEVGGVSLPTLRHYFPRREDLILAVMREDLAAGEPHLRHMGEPAGDFRESVREAIGYAAFGFHQGVGEIHTVGLTEGLRHDTLGPAFVDLVLEPSIAAVKRRLDAHVASGEMVDADTRNCAISLLSPVIVLMLHQRELGGEIGHTMDLDRFLDQHADAFVRAYASSGRAAP